MKPAIENVLVAAAGVLAVILFMGGKPIFPHVMGPFTLAVIGVILLAAKGGANRPPE